MRWLRLFAVAASIVEVLLTLRWLSQFHKEGIFGCYPPCHPIQRPYDCQLWNAHRMHVAKMVIIVCTANTAAVVRASFLVDRLLPTASGG